MLDSLKRRLLPEWNKGALRSSDWAGKIVADLKPAALLDIGCGDGKKLFDYLKHKPEKFCGVEASPKPKAEARWYARPAVWGTLAVILAIVLNIIFW